MTKIYMVRHGESAANYERIYTGQSDFPLTEKGFRQAEMAGEYFRNKGVDCVIASPLKRAYNTGETIAEYCSVPIFTDNGLMEINAGDWEGKKFDDLVTLYPESYNHFWREDIGNCVPDGGEAVRDLYHRVTRTLDKIKNEHKGQTVVLATHATPIRAMGAYLSGISAENLKDMHWASNASITYAAFDENGALCDFNYDYHDHLGDIVTGLPSNV